MADDGSTPIVLHTTVKSFDELKDVYALADKCGFFLMWEDYQWSSTKFTRRKTTLLVVKCLFSYKFDIKKILAKFKANIEDNQPTVRIQTFTNWGKTQNIAVISSSPATLNELKKLIEVANKLDFRVRCAGTGHSWAPIFSDRNNLLIYMNKMKSNYKANLKIQWADEREKTVDIMAGATTGDFKDFQLKEKIHIPANVILDVVQMVSVVATGCHGVGKEEQTPSDYVVKMRIVDAKGDLITYKPDKIELFRAIQANFGCFGVIYDMTIKVLPSVIVKVETEYRKLSEVFYDEKEIEKLFEDTWSVEMFWFPFNSKRRGKEYRPKDDEVWIRKIDKVDDNKKEKVEKTGFFNWKKKKDWLSQTALLLMSQIIDKKPSLTPLFSWSAFGIVKKIIYPAGTIYQELPNAVHFRHHIEKAPVYDMEFAFDIKSYGQVKEITEVVVKKVQEYNDKREYPLNIALEMRMMGYSDALLCPGSIGNPAYKGSGKVLYVEVLSTVNTKGWEPFCKEVAKGWIDLKYCCVPHLAKQWGFIPNIEDHINKHMGVQIKKFTDQLKDCKCDEKGMFLNNRLETLLKLKR